MEDTWIQLFIKALIPATIIGLTYPWLGMWSVLVAIVLGSIIETAIFGNHDLGLTSFKTSLISTLIPALIIGITYQWLGVWSLLLAVIVGPIIENSLFQSI